MFDLPKVQLTESIGSIFRGIAGRPVPDKEIDYVLWNHTGYPCFWTPREGESLEDSLRRQVKTYYSKHKKATSRLYVKFTDGSLEGKEDGSKRRVRPHRQRRGVERSGRVRHAGTPKNQ